MGALDSWHIMFLVRLSLFNTLVWNSCSAGVVRTPENRSLTRPHRLLRRVMETHESPVRELDTTPRTPHHHQPWEVHMTRVSFLVEAFDQHFILDLDLNHALLSGNYTEWHFDEEGNTVHTQDWELCHYHGKLRGHKDSMVAISTCQGLRGMFSDANYTYMIEPLSSSDGQEALHAVYRSTRQEHQPEDFDEPLLKEIISGESAHHWLSTSRRAQRVRRDVFKETKYIELKLINDYNMYLKHRQSVKLTNNDAKSIVNLVDAIFKKHLKTRVVLVAMETWTMEDKVSVKKDPLQTLHLFMKYHRQLVIDHSDTVHLLSGVTFQSRHSGLAYFGGICSRNHGGGVVEYGNIGTMAITLAQGIAQNLGMLRNNHNILDDKCKCPDSWHGCIMEDIGQHLPSTFSRCSLDEFKRFLQQGHGSCLFNKPTELFERPVCGNGFVELGEECDCGTLAECKRRWGRCCTKCTFPHGAMCSEGLCCTSSCDFAAKGQRCRAEVNICDIPETCTGDSGQCPPNIHKQDGYHCSNEGKCYRGVCKTRERQCKALWGSKGASADRHCYDELNIEGTEKGNCGKSEGSWVKCHKQNVLCGYLLCTITSRQPQIGELQGELTHVSIQHHGHLLECSGGRVMLDDGSDLGYVEDGTPCGPDAVCQDHRCLSLQTLNFTSCPTVNEDICSGRGLCSQEGKCVCRRNWVGNDCNIYNPITMPSPVKTTKAPVKGPSAANIIIGAIAGAILVGAIVLGGTGWGFNPDSQHVV
uniref:ADAM metallopeptidase domain 11 n=1 Tax=Eptatretus burgeri TaxID=7764 RepID=A0A8C4QPK9_EPTBU